MVSCGCTGYSSYSGFVENKVDKNEKVISQVALIETKRLKYFNIPLLNIAAFYETLKGQNRSLELSFPKAIFLGNEIVLIEWTKFVDGTEIFRTKLFR